VSSLQLILEIRCTTLTLLMLFKKTIYFLWTSTLQWTRNLFGLCIMHIYLALYSDHLVCRKCFSAVCIIKFIHLTIKNKTASKLDTTVKCYRYSSCWSAGDFQLSWWHHGGMARWIHWQGASIPLQPLEQTPPFIASLFAFLFLSPFLIISLSPISFSWLFC